ncbi:MAG: hypothetical protein Q8919_11965, partial [Bacteroidota bacterium]|nr:hypothetical protein [Bacteroidota bacterium]
MKLNRMFRFVFIALLFAGAVSSASLAQSKLHKKKTAASEPIVAVTPIYVYAQDPVFKAFVGLDLPNQLHVTGSIAKTSDFQASYTKGVNIVKLDGPGAIGGMDSVWYWRYKPFAIDTGKTYTVRFLAGATRHGGSADTMIGSFTVKVYPLVPEDPAFYSTRDEHKYPTAYTNVPFKINGRYKDLDGDYKIEVRICDKEKVCELRTFYGPYAEYTSRSPENEGKDIEINIYFRSYQSSVWLPMRTDHATVAAAPFAVVMLDKINPLKDQSIRAYYGVEGY